MAAGGATQAPLLVPRHAADPRVAWAFCATPLGARSLDRGQPPSPTGFSAADGGAPPPSLAVRSLAAVTALASAVSARKLAARSERTAGRVRLSARPRARTSVGPRKLKSGFWQEGDEDDDVDIFEWIAEEELEDEPPASLSGVTEVAAYSQLLNQEKEVFVAPEYRQPELPVMLQKGIKIPPLLDEAEERHFIHDIQDALASQATSPCCLEDIDVVTSMNSLRMLLGFVDGSLSADMRSKGLTTRRRNEPVPVDLMRISRSPEAPNALWLPAVWNWSRENSTACTGALNRMSYDVSFERAATGRRLLVGPPSTRNTPEHVHYRLLRYELGGLRMLVRTKTEATMPSIELGVLEGGTVEMESVNHRDVQELWSDHLPTRYAKMQMGDAGMVARGLVEKGALYQVQEVTREDLCLDRPTLHAETERLFGKLASVLRRAREVADCPGCKDRQLYLQFHDCELRIIAPIFDEDRREVADDDESVQEILRYVAGGVPISQR